MSISIISLDIIFSANDVDIMLFEPWFLFPPRPLGDKKHGTDDAKNCINIIDTCLLKTHRNNLLETQ